MSQPPNQNKYPNRPQSSKQRRSRNQNQNQNQASPSPAPLSQYPERSPKHYTIPFTPALPSQISSSKHHTDHFAYDKRNVPYWNSDTTTIISAPVQYAGVSWAQVVANRNSQTEFKHNVTPGPSGINKSLDQNEEEGKKARKVVFTSSGTRESEDVKKPVELQLKDMNRSIQRNATDMVIEATAKRSSVRERTENISEVAKERKPLPTVIEAPLPLKPKVSSRNPKGEKASTPTFENILKLRAKEQAKVLGKVEKSKTESHEREARKVNQSVHDSDTDHMRTTLREKKRRGTGLIARTELLLDISSSEDWARPLYDMATKQNHVNVDATVHPDDENSSSDQEGAVEGRGVFQDLSASPSERSSKQQTSAIRPAFDLGRAQVMSVEPKKGDTKEMKSEPGSQKQPTRTSTHRKTLSEAEAELWETIDISGASTLEQNGKSSAESLATTSSEDYERVDGTAEIDSEQNGAKCRWYKGFRRI